MINEIDWRSSIIRYISDIHHECIRVFDSHLSSSVTPVLCAVAYAVDNARVHGPKEMFLVNPICRCVCDDDAGTARDIVKE